MLVENKKNDVYFEALRNETLSTGYYVAFLI